MSDKTVTREGVIKSISDKSGLTIKDSEQILRSILDLMENAITKEHSLKLSSFGSFDVISKNQRLGRNPKTREDKVITPRKIVSFKASNKLKGKVFVKK